MGNQPDAVASAAVNELYSRRSWIEGTAVDQLRQVARLDGVRRVTGLPDLHPGRHGPVGCAVASGLVHPQLVGSDVGCGMSLVALDLPARRAKAEGVAERLRRLEEPWDGDAPARLEAAGLDPAWTDGLGSIGGGNHFAEVQTVAEVSDTATAALVGVDRALCHLLVHTGSRSHGYAILRSVTDRGTVALIPGTEAHLAYLSLHDAAVRWAALNRAVVAERAAGLLRADLRHVTDVPHNLVVADGVGAVHYKGAAVAAMGAHRTVPVAGSRGTPTVLVRGAEDLSASDGAVSHGCGRKYDRVGMRHRVGRNRSEMELLARNPYGGRVVCEDRDLLREEAPEAYKDVGRVVAELAAFGLAEPVATLHPLVTFKTAREARR